MGVPPFMETQKIEDLWTLVLHINLHPSGHAWQEAKATGLVTSRGTAFPGSDVPKWQPLEDSGEIFPQDKQQ